MKEVQEIKTEQEFNNLPKMKVIDMSDKTSAKAYLTRPPSDTHTKEELEAIHRAVRFTQMFMQKESFDKMDEESVIEHKLPAIKRSHL